MYEDSALNFPRAGKRLYSIVHPLTTNWFQDGFFKVTILQGRGYYSANYWDSHLLRGYYSANYWLVTAVQSTFLAFQQSKSKSKINSVPVKAASTYSNIYMHACRCNTANYTWLYTSSCTIAGEARNVHASRRCIINIQQHIQWRQWASLIVTLLGPSVVRYCCDCLPFLTIC